MASKYYLERVIIPQNEINKKYIERLFSMLGNFDLSQIINFTSEYNMTYNVTDNIGRSVLHILIDIDDINKNEDVRLHIIKYFIKNGVDVDSPDINNITPLHLACKKQYYKIANYLINYGADPSFEDSQMMTSLHYAIQGQTKVCHKIRKIESLIENPDSKDIDKIDELIGVKELIAQLLYKDDNLNKYISHIVNTIKCTQNYDKKGLIKKEINDIFSNIFKKLNNTKSSYEKTTESIQVEIYNSIKNVSAKIQEIHKRSQNDVDFELIYDDNKAWGIENMNIKLLKSDDTYSIEKNIEKNIQNFDNHMGNLEDKIIKFKEELKDLNIDISSLESNIDIERVHMHFNLLSNIEYKNLKNKEPQTKNEIKKLKQEVSNKLIGFSEKKNKDKTKEFIETDDILRHPHSVSFRDSIFDFKNKVYLQGFNDYRIKKIDYFTEKSLDDINEYNYFYNILSNLLDVENINKEKLESITNNYGTLVERNSTNSIQGATYNEAFLFFILRNCILKTDINKLRTDTKSIYNLIDNKLKCHFNEVIKTFKDINFILISCINAYYRIVCKQCNTSDNNFTYYMKVLYNSLNQWTFDSNLNKVKSVVFNNLKILNLDDLNLKNLIKLILNNGSSNPDPDTNLILYGLDNINNDLITSLEDYQNKTPFEQKIMNNLNKIINIHQKSECDDSSINNIEIIIQMIKFHFYNHDTKPDILEKMNLHNLINILRKNKNDNMNIKRLINASFVNFDKMGLNIEEEERKESSNIQTIIGLLAAQIAGENNNANLENISDSIKNVTSLDAFITQNQNVNERILILTYIATSLTITTDFEDMIASLDNKDESLISLFKKYYYTTGDVIFSTIKLFEFYGTSRNASIILKKALYKNQEKLNKLNRRNLSSLINNVCIASIMELTYLDKILPMKINNDQIYLENKIIPQTHTYKNKKIYGTFYLGEFVDIEELDNGEQDDNCFYNINKNSLIGKSYITDDLIVSTFTSSIKVIKNKIIKLVDILKNILVNDDSNQSSVNKIFENLINKKYTNYHNLNNINYLLGIEVLEEIKGLELFYNSEIDTINKIISKYYQKKLELANKYSKRSLDILDNESFDKITTNNEFEENVLLIFDYISIFNSLNYLNKVLNLSDGKISINNFYDGYIANTEIGSLTYYSDMSDLLEKEKEKDIGYNINLNNNYELNIRDGTIQGTPGFIKERYTESLKNQASKSIIPIIPFYLYIIKKELCKKIIETIYTEKDSSEIFKQVSQYIEKTKIYLKEENKEPIILSLIGALTNELLNKYIKYIQNKHANLIVLKSVKPLLNIEEEDKLSSVSDKFILINTKDNFKNSLDKPSSKLIDAFLESIKDNEEFSPFNFTYDPIVVDELKKMNNNYLYNNNYTSNIIKRESNLCLDINKELIKLIINNHCPINKRDKDGHSPIFYSIKNMHLESLQILLEHGADFNSVPNKLNQTPIDYALDLYKINLDYINSDSMSDMINKFYKYFYNITRNLILDNPSNKNNIIKYSENGYGMIICLINHWCLKKMNDYSETWNYDNKKELIELINKYNLLDKKQVNLIKYYLLDSYNENKDNIVKGKESLHVIKYQIKEYTKSIDVINTEIKNLKESLDNLNKEIDLVTDQNLKNNLVTKRDKIKKLKEEADAKLLFLDTNKEELNKELDKALINPKKELNKAFSDFQNNSEILTNTVINNYNNISKSIKIIGVNKDDSYCYNKMWKTYLKNDKLLSNINNIHLIVNKLEKKVIDSDNTTLNKLKELKIIDKFYQNLSGDITGYFNLSKKLDENKILNMNFEFIKHITKNVLAEALVLSIKDLIFEEIRQIIPYDPIIYTNRKTYFYYLFNKLDDVFNKNINIDGNNHQIDDYIKNELNTYIVQNIMDVKRDNNDYILDEFEGVEEILKRINQVLILNTGIVLGEDSKALTYIDKYLIPYYALNYKLIVTNLNEIFDNYLRYLINNQKHLKIIIELLKN